MAARARRSDLGEVKKAQSRSSKAGLQFSMGRITRFLKAGKYVERVDTRAPVYLAAVLEYLAVEVWELSVMVAGGVIQVTGDNEVSKRAMLAI
ncbi:histone [Olea europaea subsp. europaea]|uniref:Histone H2A n=1 Tax=Olea europaea subsp. europaea TaxID=158383 RepID=A0A8S0UCR5_OLEEU|nr:histone [Olea europaea subsp. europaea]